MTERGIKPVLFGYGLTTKAIASSLGGGCVFYDDNCVNEYVDKNNNTILPSSQFDPELSTLEVTTPSLPPHHPLIKKANNLKSEYDFVLGNIKEKPLNIWISGTNGKTTTTQMLTHLLDSKGAVSGGNIGVPLANLDPDVPIWVLESSSYTLHHTKLASPDIYLLLPITPDHLDWHGDANSYEADKLRPLLVMKEGELALVPSGLNLPETNAWVVEYDSDNFLEEFFDLDSSKLDYKAAFLQDALLSLAITRVLFDEADYELLNRFKLDHHRQEEIVDSSGRLWVNDSKATNIDATVQAINAYKDKNIHLVLGGDDKGVDLSSLMDMIANAKITIYAVGANSHRLCDMAQNRGIPYYMSQTLENAIDIIDNNLHQNEVALLSPAASSLDQFTSYIKRGELFMKLIRDLSDA